jgi:hypothetical protein
VPKGTHAHKVQLAGDLLVVNQEQYPYRVGVPERSGLLVYDVSRPAEPREIGFLPIDGLGVHRTWFTGDRYAYASAREKGYRNRIFIVADLADPEHPTLASRWWWPGQSQADPDPLPEGSDISAHGLIIQGDRAYAGYFDAGIVVYAVAGGRLERLSSLSWADASGGHPHTHTALPLGDRKLLAATDEAIEPNCEGARKDVHLIDISDERAPRQVSAFPVPEGDYCTRGLRFGPHNVHENRPGTFQSDTLVFVTYFNAGLRVYDTSDPLRPREVAAFVPEAPAGQEVIQLNDVLVDADRNVFVTDRMHGGLYILRLT